MKSFRQYLSDKQSQYDNTIIKLIELYKDSFRGNEKTLLQLNESLINTEDEIEKRLIKEKIKQEFNRIEAIINKAEMIKSKSLNEKLMNVMKWVANNGKNPIEGFADNAEFRMKSMLRKIEK